MTSEADIPPEVLEGLIGIEAEVVAHELGIPVDRATEVTRKLWDKRKLEVRRIGDGKYVLCRHEGTAWLQAIPGGKASE